MQFSIVALTFTTTLALAGPAPSERHMSMEKREAFIEHQRRDVCEDPFSPCQYAESDGTCTVGYEGCIKKMGGTMCMAGETNCIGTATGCSVC